MTESISQAVSAVLALSPRANVAPIVEKLCCAQVWTLTSTSRGGKRIWRINLCCSTSRPCLLPVFYLNSEFMTPVVQLLKDLHFEVTEVLAEEVPYDILHPEDEYPAFCVRRRALTFPFVMGAIVSKDTHLCAYLGKTMEVLACDAGRFPAMVDTDSCQDMITEAGSLAELLKMDVCELLTGGSKGCGTIPRRSPYGGSSTHCESAFVSALLVGGACRHKGPIGARSRPAPYRPKPSSSSSARQSFLDTPEVEVVFAADEPYGLVSVLLHLDSLLFPGHIASWHTQRVTEQCITDEKQTDEEIVELYQLTCGASVRFVRSRLELDASTADHYITRRGEEFVLFEYQPAPTPQLPLVPEVVVDQTDFTQLAEQDPQEAKELSPASEE
eukprot:6491351-Amphidinium_carterae.1